jgi:hypothetical protein
MRQILRFMAAVVVIGAVLTGLDILSRDGRYPILSEWRSYLFDLPIIRDVFGQGPMTFSQWVTVVLIVLGVIYLVVHFFELVFRGGASIVGRSHDGFETRHHMRRFFLSAMIIKGLLVLVQVALLFTQAMALRDLLHGVINNPQSFVDLLRTDIIFLTLLVVLILLRLVRPGSDRIPES